MLHSDADYVDTWPEMEKLVRMGLVRSIGVSNFNSKQIERVLNVAKIKPVMNQVIFCAKLKSDGAKKFDPSHRLSAIRT